MTMRPPRSERDVELMEPAAYETEATSERASEPVFGTDEILEVAESETIYHVLAKTDLTCQSCGEKADVMLVDGSNWCWSCKGSARRMGYDDA
jgi:hypothetical protein